MNEAPPAIKQNDEASGYTESESPWLRVAEAAAYCRVHPGQVLRAARERTLQHGRRQADRPDKT
jgi:hypothetical protein